MSAAISLGWAESQKREVWSGCVGSGGWQRGCRVRKGTSCLGNGQPQKSLKDMVVLRSQWTGARCGREASEGSGRLKEGTKTMLSAIESDRETEQVPISGSCENPCCVCQGSLLKILVTPHILTVSQP